LPLIPEMSEEPCVDVKTRPMTQSFSAIANMTQCQDVTDAVYADVHEECHSIPEVKCANLPRSVQATIHKEVCVTEFDQECSSRYEQQWAFVTEKCTIGIEAERQVVNERKCKTVEDEVCEEVPSKQCHIVNERKCSASGDEREGDKAYGVTVVMFSDQNKFRKKVGTNLQPFITFGQQCAAVPENEERRDVSITRVKIFLGGVVMFLHVRVIDVIKITIVRFVKIILLGGVVTFIQ